LSHFYFLRVQSEVTVDVSEIAKKTDLSAKKSSAKKIFGSNLSLSAKKIFALPQNEWAALAAAVQNSGKIPVNTILVNLYDSARTYFSKNV
jgi:hypothetical protein